MMGYGADLGLGGLLSVLGCVLLVVGLVLLAVFVFDRLGGSSVRAASGVGGPSVPSVPDAMEVLRLRLARGEVTVEEFAASKHALEAGR